MPHKHKRSRRDDDDSLHDLPPTVIAKPLAPKDFSKPKTYEKGKNKRKRGIDDTTTNSNGKASAGSADGAAKSKKKKRVKTMEDDTPKAFLRIMQQMQGKKLDRGPDDGNDRRTKGKKKGGKADTEMSSQPAQQQQQQQQIEIPKIMPGEKLSDFAARVDQAMPLAGISKKGGGSAVPGLKIREARTTKHEKHLRRLQKGWREEEERLRAKEEEEREEREAAMAELEEQWRALEAEAGPTKKRKGHKKGGKGKAEGYEEEEGDPWAKLNKKARQQVKNPLETADAPPTLTKIKPKFKMYSGAGVNVANVPTKAGSLRRREELKEERESIVEQYRRLMAEKRAGVA